VKLSLGVALGVIDPCMMASVAPGGSRVQLGQFGGNVIQFSTTEIPGESAAIRSDALPDQTAATSAGESVMIKPAGELQFHTKEKK
jgi:hypothetical protein